jgi:hypothetical protein
MMRGMKANVDALKKQAFSMLRHLVTGAAAVGAWLAAEGVIRPEDAGEVGAAAEAAAGEVGAFVVALSAAVAARVCMGFLAAFTRPRTKGAGSMNGSLGGLPLAGVWAAGSVVMASLPLTLTGCADYRGPRIVVGVEHEDARVSYDSAKGGTVRVDARVRGTK